MRPWSLTVLLTLVYALVVVAMKGDPLALVTVGTRFSIERYNYSEEGYDGQFVYFIARDPASAAALIAQGGDIPAYRYQRILLPALGWMLSLGGQDDLVPFALLGVNLIALGVGTALLERLLVERRVSRWYALGYGLSALASARLSLTEPLAYGLAIGGLYLAYREKWLWSAGMFALAALAKETTLVVAAGVGLYLLAHGRSQIGRTASFGVVVLLPFALWQIALRAMFGAFGVGSGGRLATSFELIPFAGVFQILTVGGAQIFVTLMLLLLPFVLLPTVWGLWRGWHDLRAGNVTLSTWVLLTTALIMLFVPFSTYREILGILRFIAGLQIAVILYAAERRQIRALRYSTFWAFTSLLVIASDFST
jgi:hypothetical protein